MFAKKKMKTYLQSNFFCRASTNPFRSMISRNEKKQTFSIIILIWFDWTLRKCRVPKRTRHRTHLSCFDNLKAETNKSDLFTCKSDGYPLYCSLRVCFFSSNISYISFVFAFVISHSYSSALLSILPYSKWNGSA